VSLLDAEIDADAALEARAAGRLGETLRDKYRLDRVLGIGGMATVYAATHRNGKEVALKLLHPEFTHHAEVRNRFLREGYVANQVKHSGAVAVLDDDVMESGGAFLVMELLSGVTVQDLWDERDHRVHPAWVTAITLQLLDVLASAHAHGVIHRDLKPANLFVTRDGELKVLDFGIARMRSSGIRTTAMSGGVLGTPAFMAPEQARGKGNEVDETTDLWAVAAVAFALLVGDVVHPAENTQETVIFAATRPARPLGPLAPDAPASIVHVLERALEFERSARWPSAQAMREALATAALEAYHELPDRAVLREALGFARERSALSSPEETMSLGPACPVVVSPTDPPALHRVPVLGVDVPVQRLATLAAETTSPGASVALPAASREPRPLSTGRARLLVAAGIVGVSLLGLPRFHRADHAPADEPAYPADIVPASLSSFSFAAPTLPARDWSGGAEPSRPVAAEVPSAPAPSGSAHAHAPASSAVKSVPFVAPAALASTKSAWSATALASGSKPNCTPPYAIDKTNRRKVWKIECL
jgi:eukaryotic-like serine/threonine-protein kinase